MKNKSLGVAKMVTLAVVPLCLSAVVANVAQRRRAEAATKELLAECAMGTATTKEVTELIAHGADVNAHSATGETPLMTSISHADIEVVRLLLRNGASVHTQARVANGEYDSPLFNARYVLKSRVDRPKDFNPNVRRIIKLLKAAGAKE